MTSKIEAGAKPVTFTKNSNVSTITSFSLTNIQNLVCGSFNVVVTCSATTWTSIGSVNIKPKAAASMVLSRASTLQPIGTMEITTDGTVRIYTNVALSGNGVFGLIAYIT